MLAIGTLQHRALRLKVVVALALRVCFPRAEPHTLLRVTPEHCLQFYCVVALSSVSSNLLRIQKCCIFSFMCAFVLSVRGTRLPRAVACSLARMSTELSDRSSRVAHAILPIFSPLHFP
jgi:hypothetical protein